MLYLTCPNCGRRTVEEFRFGEIPTVPDSIEDVDVRDVDRGFMRTNSFGPTFERWFHDHGCRRWFTISRDTSTDEVL